MKDAVLAQFFYKEVLSIHEMEEVDLAAQVAAQYRLLNHLFVESTKAEQLKFSTLFARIAFAGHKYNLSKQSQFFIHEFRKLAQELAFRPAQVTVDKLVIYQLGLHSLTLSIASIFKQGIPGELAALQPMPGFYQKSPEKITGHQDLVRVVALSMDAERETLLARTATEPGEEVRVQYNIADRNASFTKNIKSLETVFGFPVILNLLDVDVDANGVFRPRAFVIEPDYLVDVSAIAECFKEGTTLPVIHLLKKFMPFQQSEAIMLGNIANFFLDELMTNPEATFQNTFPKVFRLNPLAFTLFENRQVREIMGKAQKHYVTLKNMVLEGFAASDIETQHCFLEPSFYAQQYGIQGRLDIFYNHPEKEKDAAIVELKSGSIWQPNKYGISQNHYVQTLLYDLMIKSAFGGKLSPTNFILYSGADDKPLRFAPATKAIQYEAIELRNRIVIIEYQLVKLHQDEAAIQLLRRIHPERYPTIKGFLGRDLGYFANKYRKMSPLELAYFHAFTGLIAREHQLAKTGIQGVEGMNGLASLWLNNMAEKTEQFDIIPHLEIRKLQTQAEEPLIYFDKTPASGTLANFRKGDIAVIYPQNGESNNVLNNQIFKCTIVELSETAVTVRLRSKQFNNQLFEDFRYWNIEHDLFDSGYTSMYRSLFEFFHFPENKKSLLLTTRAPQQPATYEDYRPPKMTMEQIDIFNQAIHAPEYFLLWGPPGTGKTSVMLKELVNHIINETDENILLLAYTNRAVDEICEAIESIDSLMKNEYIRIGSRYSTSPKFQGRLLNTLSADIQKRAKLRELIDNHRIFVSTVASITSKKDLLKLKTFNRVIIDEASQILEPLLVGLLPHFEKFILIGDHKQLPAVVSQSATESATASEALQNIGLHNLRDSLFERLFKRCKANNWDWAYAQLSHQGRMHEELMAFPNQHFYDNQLQILPEELKAHHLQKEPLKYALPHECSELETKLCQSRTLFIPTRPDQGTQFKINIQEAKLIGDLVDCYVRIYEANGIELTANSIGIITPYRAQIAQIRQELSTRTVPLDLLTVDTVERYQGGARDIILISLCANRASQLASLVSESDEGVDRKLNVALTRARKHLVVLGNAEVLRENKTYGKLILEFGIGQVS